MTGLPAFGRSRAPGCRFTLGAATGWSVWATQCMADSYGMGEDLLLRYRLPEYYLSVFWHVLFVIVFLVLLWRLKKRMDRADRGGVISSVLLLAAWAGLWFGGAAGLRAGLEFLAESQPEPGWLQRWSQDW